MRATTSKTPILVTGAHRSGTTWVGKTLAANPGIGYIDEPFSPALNEWSPGTCNAQFDQWWMYITEENELGYYDDLAAAVEFRYRLMPQLQAVVKHKRGVRTSMKGFVSFTMNRYIYQARPLLKDPIALFSAEWLARRFSMDVVVMIRHPAAFVSSIKRMGWPHDFANFLQPLLLRDYLAPFEDEIRRYVAKKHDAVAEAILLWRLFYYVVETLRTRHDDFIFVRHEDISRKPQLWFDMLFTRLDISPTAHTRRLIQDQTKASNPAEAPDGVAHQLRRNSNANVRNWQTRLSPEEIRRVREGVEDVSHFFYSDEDWE